MIFYDKDTELHCKRVEALVKGFLEENPDAFTLKEELVIAAKIHDIGKNKIPDAILNAPRTLTPEERNIIDTHSYYSYVIAKEEGYSETVCQLVLLHHGDDKPYCAEIDASDEVKKHADFLRVVDTYDELINVKRHADFLRVIDAYDALINPRVYHNGRSEESVLSILKESPKDFPSDMVDMFFAWDGRIEIEKAFKENTLFKENTSPVEKTAMPSIRNLPLTNTVFGKRNESFSQEKNENKQIDNIERE